MLSPYADYEVDDSDERRSARRIFWLLFVLGLITLAAGSFAPSFFPDARGHQVQAALFAASGHLNEAAAGRTMQFSLNTNFIGQRRIAESRLTAGFVLVWGLVGLALAYVAIAGGDGPGYSGGGAPHM
jgi:hypothetical protein